MAKHVQKEEVLSSAVAKKVDGQLVVFFRQEKPPADYVEVVPGSIKPVDVKFRLYKALIRTDVYAGGVKQHISNIRFKLDQTFNVISSSITFS